MKSAKHNSGMDKRLKTLAETTQKQKDALLEELAKCPIVLVACERTSIGRATYYKWRTEDDEFRKISDKAVSEGRKFVNDIAESQMIRKIKEGNMTSIIYWLKNNNPRYNERHEEEIEPLGVLPPDQAKDLVKALHLMGLTELIRRSKELGKIYLESEEEIKSKSRGETLKKEVGIKTSEPQKRGSGVKINEFLKRKKED